MERTIKMVMFSLMSMAIGLAIAIKLNAHFWWAGMVVGGLVGYLSYEWREVASAIAKLSANERRIRIWGQTLVRLAIFVFVEAGWLALLAYPIIYGEIYPHAFIPGMVQGLSVSAAAAGLLFSFIFGFLPAIVIDPDDKEDEEKFIKSMFNACFPIVFYRHLPRGLKYLWINIPTFARLAWRLLIMICSADRLIVSFSAIMGIATGYAAHGSFAVGTAVTIGSVLFMKFALAGQLLKAYLPRYK